MIIRITSLATKTRFPRLRNFFCHVTLLLFCHTLFLYIINIKKTNMMNDENDSDDSDTIMEMFSVDPVKIALYKKKEEDVRIKRKLEEIEETNKNSAKSKIEKEKQTKRRIKKEKQRKEEEEQKKELITLHKRTTEAVSMLKKGNVFIYNDSVKNGKLFRKNMVSVKFLELLKHSSRNAKKKR